VNSEITKWLKENAGKIIWRGAEAFLGKLPAVKAFSVFIEGLGLKSTSDWEERVTRQIEANFSSPKDLDELALRPEGDTFGYGHHHIVEQNDSNLAKKDQAPEVDAIKFGDDAIQDDSNLVWIPALKHKEITSVYNRAPPGGQSYSRYRDHVNTFDFAAQRQIGLDVLRKVGVLK
jgi:hypothetical protein